GNGREGATPGGAGSLIEIRVGGQVTRHDIYISAPDTTNNRMALAGAIATFALLSRKGRRLRVLYVSDSEYLVKGMTSRVPGWRGRRPRDTSWASTPTGILPPWKGSAEVDDGIQGWRRRKHAHAEPASRRRGPRYRADPALRGLHADGRGAGQAQHLRPPPG